MSDRLRRQHRFTVTPEHLILDPRVSDRAFRLWCRLDRFAGNDESAYPTRETLCIELDTSPASVDRATKELVTAGWLKKERRSAGDTCLYTLIVAPEREVERLIKKAREERIAATEPRREKEREKRREKERRQRQGQTEASNVNASDGRASVQVSPAPLVTGDKRVGSAPLVTGDKRGVVTGEETPLVTGDGEKEATPEGSNSEGLFSSATAGAAADTATSNAPEQPSEKNQRDDVTRICEHLVARMVENGCKKPTITNRWRDAARLMLDNDGRTEAQVHNMIEWATRDEFWRANILSLPKLREKYDQMKLRATQEATTKGMRRGYDDVATWGKAEEEEVVPGMNAEEAAAFFGQRRQVPGKTGTNG